MIKINCLYTLIFASFLATSSYADNDPPVLPDKESFHLFLLAGQSNMAGRGEISDYDLVVPLVA